jgi:ribosomal protein L11 methyltransferase
VKAYRAHYFLVRPNNKIELVSAWLTSFSFESYEQKDDGIVAYAPLDEVDTIDTNACVNVPFDGVEVSLKTEDIAGQNWNAIWEDNFHPIEVGDWTVRASFHPAATTPHELIIDPQMSFGTGHHATTQQMLTALVALEVQDKSVLDMGTGTGVLAIIAKKLGAGSVTGVDIEDWCVANAQENATKNSVTDIVFSKDKLSSLRLQKQDVILANINRNVLLEHIPEYARLLRPNGILLLSGFHQQDVADLTALAQKHGLKPNGQTTQSNWICLKFIL